MLFSLLQMMGFSNLHFWQETVKGKKHIPLSSLFLDGQGDVRQEKKAKALFYQPHRFYVISRREGMLGIACLACKWCTWCTWCTQCTQCTQCTWT